MIWYVRYKVSGFPDGIREMEIGPFNERHAESEARDIDGYEGVFAVYKISETDRKLEAEARAREIYIRTEPKPEPTGYWSPEE